MKYNSVPIHKGQASVLCVMAVLAPLISPTVNYVLVCLQYSQTPLHIASEGGHTETVRLLLERGAEVDARDEVSSFHRIRNCMIPSVVLLVV